MCLSQRANQARQGEPLATQDQWELGQNVPVSLLSCHFRPHLPKAGVCSYRILPSLSPLTASLPTSGALQRALPSPTNQILASESADEGQPCKSVTAGTALGWFTFAGQTRRDGQVGAICLKTSLFLEVHFLQCGSTHESVCNFIFYFYLFLRQCFSVQPWLS